MQSRRKFVLGLVSAAVALCVIVVPVLAAELMGTIKSVDADNNKFVVTGDDGKDVTVTVNGSTVYESDKGKADKKLTQAGFNIGGPIKVIHENGTASKLITSKGDHEEEGRELRPKPAADPGIAGGLAVTTPRSPDEPAAEAAGLPAGASSVGRSRSGPPRRLLTAYPFAPYRRCTSLTASVPRAVSNTVAPAASSASTTPG